MKKKGAGYSAVISVTLTALISGFLLSFIYSKFEVDIELNKQRALIEGVQEAIASADKIDGPLMDLDNSNLSYYIGYNTNDNIVGYAILASSVGYNGPINVLVGFNPSVTEITAVVATEHSETPGLGSKVNDELFKSQFVKKAIDKDLSSVKGVKIEDTGDYEISAISGATISTDSVIKSVNLAKVEALSLFANKQ